MFEVIAASTGNNKPNDKFKKIDMMAIQLGVRPTNKFLISGVNINNPGALPISKTRAVKAGYVLKNDNLIRPNETRKASKGQANKKFAPLFNV